MLKSYGVSLQKEIKNSEEIIFEEIEIKGFSLIKNVISNEELDVFRSKLDELNTNQKKEFGEDKLISGWKKIKEDQQIRKRIQINEQINAHFN